MKIAISSEGKDLDSNVDARFGRTPFFVIVDINSNDFYAIENSKNFNAAQGAGIQSAQNIVNQGVAVVITGNCGPKAYKVLSESNIKIACAAGITVKTAIEHYKNGMLELMGTANVAGHW
ncbi:MAG: dinitrogenase iron-molybdenum cofactor biosynthesis protein [Candidatus Margulisiibacteriota bacterium]|nr:MAG: hypothetical protein A2X43_00090 [Candidatus Margulisbacteria bacterium GWD2_39_127]OGI02243.1 MAG: hypothetical protein A2X42_03985 [Candidatus Margulisbacteria bacterium GWF2_38_17]OGI11477.1 MAG: hypothetical protein A2X41_05925 [Candidatus Margulisbacteria bacterium GWE2_39_32]PZM81938.1 MAG: dinitrogenase iron-molybdenum cofactor biosynthesis protein [Candidatus Margulisiibacteriota bacterium]HAR63709.1 dinitrogenase iron-molybdenum cofactor biosynthesis protein [Candidatus Marguli